MPAMAPEPRLGGDWTLGAGEFDGVAELWASTGTIIASSAEASSRLPLVTKSAAAAAELYIWVSQGCGNEESLGEEESVSLVVTCGRGL